MKLIFGLLISVFGIQAEAQTAGYLPSGGAVRECQMLFRPTSRGNDLPAASAGAGPNAGSRQFADFSGYAITGIAGRFGNSGRLVELSVHEEKPPLQLLVMVDGVPSFYRRVADRARDSVSSQTAVVVSQSMGRSDAYIEIRKAPAQRDDASNGFPTRSQSSLARTIFDTLESLSSGRAEFSEPRQDSLSRMELPGAVTVVQTPVRGVFMVGMKSGDLYLVAFGRKPVRLTSPEMTELISSSRSDGIVSPFILADAFVADGLFVRHRSENDVTGVRTAIVDLSIQMSVPPAGFASVSFSGVPRVPPSRVRIVYEDGRIEIHRLTNLQLSQMVQMSTPTSAKPH